MIMTSGGSRQGEDLCWPPRLAKTEGRESRWKMPERRVGEYVEEEEIPPPKKVEYPASTKMEVK